MPKMLRRHYNAIAAALRSGSVSEEVVRDIGDIFANTYDLFNYDKFVDKALNGKTQEQRSKQYRVQLKRVEAWRARA